MSLMRNQILAVAIAIISVSCTAKKPIVRLNEPAGLTEGWEGTAILLTYELQNDKPCLLNLKNQDTGGLYQAELSPEKHHVLVDAPQGKVVATGFSCDKKTEWTLEKFLRDETELVEGKINYLGKVSLKFNEKGTLSLKYRDRASDSESLRQALKALPEGWRIAVVVAATRRPVKEGMLPPKTDYGLSTKSQKFTRQEGVTTESLVKALRECDQAEHARVPVRIGNLSWLGTYEGGKLKELKKETNDHAFSDDFEDCMEAAYRGFKPNTQDKVEVRTTL